jgi:hypothetical protein
MGQTITPQPWVSLDDCLEVFDRAILWDAKREDELFPCLNYPEEK